MLYMSFRLFSRIMQGARTDRRKQSGCRDLEVPVQGSGAFSSRWKLICVMLILKIAMYYFQFVVYITDQYVHEVYNQGFKCCTDM